MNLAQLEMAIAFGTLFQRLPGLRLDPERPPLRKSSLLFRGLHALPALV
jgi:cytochrome P450